MHWIPLLCGIGIVAYASLLTARPRFLAELRPLMANLETFADDATGPVADLG